MVFPKMKLISIELALTVALASSVFGFFAVTMYRELTSPLNNEIIFRAENSDDLLSNYSLSEKFLRLYVIGAITALILSMLTIVAVCLKTQEEENIPDEVECESITMYYTIVRPKPGFDTTPNLKTISNIPTQNFVV